MQYKIKGGRYKTYTSLVKVLLYFKASARLTAPSTPILLKDKLIGVKFITETKKGHLLKSSQGIVIFQGFCNSHCSSTNIIAR
jgi:hypothetical protein